MVKQKQLEEFMEKHINYCSLTYWSKDVTKVVTYSDIKEKFSDKFVFVALNPTKSCHAFHSGSPQDGKLKDIFGRSDNVYYITDLFKLKVSEVKKEVSLKNSKDVIRYAEDHKLIGKSVITLKNELSLIGENPTVIAFGDKVYKLLLENKCLLCNGCKSHPNIEVVYHFSDFRKSKLIEQLKKLKVFQ